MNIIPLSAVSAALGKAVPIIIAILFFGILIFFHELGHFLFAKLFGVQVNEFAMGMGPTLFKFKKGETKYAVRLLPIGGFVSMEGEDTESENERAFCRKPAWQRFIIVAAGGIINIIMGIIIVSIMLTQSDLVGLPVIHSFSEGAVSCNYGLEAGDRILKINDKHVFAESDVSFLMARDKDAVIDFTVKRNGEKVEVPGVKFNSSLQEINGKEQMFISFDFIILGKDPTFSVVAKNTFLESLSLSRIVWISLFDLVTGQYGLSDLSGPVGTVSYVADAAQQAQEETDYSYLLLLMAIIALNIGIFNLLPLPALDGGRLLFVLIEIIFRKPVPSKYESWVHAVGMVLLMALMAVITFSDILRLVRGG